MTNKKNKEIERLKKEFEKVMLEWLEQDLPPGTGYAIAGQEWWKQKFGMNNRIWNFFEKHLTKLEQEVREELRGEINKNYWNKLIPQANKDFLEKFINYAEKKDLTVLSTYLGGKSKFAGLRWLADEFLSFLTKEKCERCKNGCFGTNDSACACECHQMKGVNKE